MKIIIIGAGISGLSTYLFLHKFLPPSLLPSLEILIYESHFPRTTTTHLDDTSFDHLASSTAIVGGGLGISPNGMRVLRDLGQDVYYAVVAQGALAETFTFKTAGGVVLGSAPTRDQGTPTEACLGTSRHGVWRCLRDKIPDGAIVYKKIREVVMGMRGTPCIRTAEGEEVEADVIIGADGVKSVVRDYVFRDAGIEFEPRYEGIAGVGGFLNLPLPEDVVTSKAMVFNFGRSGQFGYSAYTPSPEKVMWWSNSEVPNVKEFGSFKMDDIKQQLQERHGDWKDPLIKQIIEQPDVDTVYPVFVMPTIPYWGKEGCILIGDAAHALPPSGGQGASQCLESAQTVALLLAHYLQHCSGPDTSIMPREAADLTAKGLHEIRSSRVLSIYNRAKRIGAQRKMTRVEALVMFAFLWLLIKSPWVGKMVVGDINKELYGWNAHTEVEKWLAQR